MMFFDFLEFLENHVYWIGAWQLATIILVCFFFEGAKDGKKDD